MKIKGETIRDVADFAQGMGKTAEPLLDGVSNVLGATGDRLENGFRRKARAVEFKEVNFRNGDDWTQADRTSMTVHASVSNGGTTLELTETVEFIHFGHVYRDSSLLFPNPSVDDTAAGNLVAAAATTPATTPSTTTNGRTPVQGPADQGTRGETGRTRPNPNQGQQAQTQQGQTATTTTTPATQTRDIPAHGLMYRAALMRETVLLGGFIRGQMDALIAEEKSKGVVGVLAQVFADLTGSAGGTEDKPSPVDLNAHIKKVIEAGKVINKAKVTYPDLHATGRELHKVRKAYREWVVSENEKRHAPVTAPTPNPGGGILNQQVPNVNKSLAEGAKWLNVKDVVPKLTAIIPGEAQQFLSVVQRISFKAWDVYASLIYEYCIRLEPVIEDACRSISVASIKKRATPIFPVWYLEAQEFPALPADIEQQIFDKIDNPIPAQSGILGSAVTKLNQLLDVVTDPVKAELHRFDNAVGIDKTLDFLSRPDRYTPGRPHLDDIFMVPPDPDPAELPSGDKRARTGWSAGLGQMAVDSFKGALSIEKLPGWLEWIVSKVSTVAAEFVRSIYGKILTLKDTDQVTEDELLEAAKRHLVGNIIESILGGLKFVRKLRNFAFKFPIGDVNLSVDALIGRAKEFATQKLEKFIDPVVRYAMRDLYETIFAYRATAITNKALTMEVHLAQLPVLFARLFRNIFFPLWDMVIERTLEALTASLMPKVHEAARKILHAKEEVDNVRSKIHKTLAGLNSLPQTLPDVAFDIMHPQDSIKKIKKEWGPIADAAKKAYDEETTQDLSGAYDILESAFPLQQRILACECPAVTDTELKKLKEHLKWKVEDEPDVDDLGFTGEVPAGQDVGKVTGEQAMPANHQPPSPYAAYANLGRPTMPSHMQKPAAPEPPPAPTPQAFAPSGLSAEATQNLGNLGERLGISPESLSGEHTQQFQVSPELRMANMDETVSIDNARPSQLPPFLADNAASKAKV